jgi:hypothetical protein
VIHFPKATEGIRYDKEKERYSNWKFNSHGIEKRRPLKEKEKV